jgi:hypothetical protein
MSRWRYLWLAVLVIPMGLGVRAMALPFDLGGPLGG